jgi:hypothetical protein
MHKAHAQLHPDHTAASPRQADNFFFFFLLPYITSRLLLTCTGNARDAQRPEPT